MKTIRLYKRIRKQIRKNEELTYKHILLANIHKATKEQIDRALVLLRATEEVRIEGQTFKAA